MLLLSLRKIFAGRAVLGVRDQLQASWIDGCVADGAGAVLFLVNAPERPLDLGNLQAIFVAQPVEQSDAAFCS